MARHGPKDEEMEAILEEARHPNSPFEFEPELVELLDKALKKAASGQAGRVCLSRLAKAMLARTKQVDRGPRAVREWIQRHWPEECEKIISARGVRSRG